VLDRRLIVLTHDPIVVRFRAAVCHQLRQVLLDLEADAGREAAALSRAEYGVRHEPGDSSGVVPDSITGGMTCGKPRAATSWISRQATARNSHGDHHERLGGLR
jgi:hypothetical protein